LKQFGHRALADWIPGSVRDWALALSPAPATTINAARITARAYMTSTLRFFGFYPCICDGPDQGTAGAEPAAISGALRGGTVRLWPDITLTSVGAGV
jgi:hypothetical protein